VPTNRANFTPPTVGTLLRQRYEEVDPHTLTLHPENANQGDIGEIMTSIATTGFFGALLAQESSRVVCAGNHRLPAVINLGMPKVPVIFLDVDDAMALRILVSDNRLARLGFNDQDAMVILLQQIAVGPHGLEGTGYDGDDLDAMLAEIADGTPDWDTDNTTPDPVAKLAVHRITIDFDDVTDRDACAHKIEELGYHPKVTTTRVASKRTMSEP